MIFFYFKLLIFNIYRLEKSGEKLVSNEDIKIIVDKIEEEMYRVYGKVDNSYKNKFRSLLANISNMNNNVNSIFFYHFFFSKQFFLLSFFINIFFQKKLQLNKLLQ